MLQNEKESEFSLSTLWQQLNFCILLQVALYPFSGRRDLVSAEQGYQFRFYCLEFRLFDQNLTFIFLNLEFKYTIFRTEISVPVSSENRKNDRNFGLSDRNGKHQ